MSIPPGARLGPYEVVRSLGAGGMGEVYRATDTNLKRQVALKVLPAGVAGDAERLARFQREAEVLAALNHPHIAQIYGLEKSADTTALAMELVEGEDLAQRIARGLIPLDEALPIAKQIAEALEAAHDQGIIHRDLKPANIKVRADGTVKVLDFGLAKALESPSSLQTPASSLSLWPTLTSPAAMTGVGTILGTAAYMAPEQARGKAVDRRADMWAFGCVLFEMLAGGRPFDGETITDVLGAVVGAEPDWSRLPRGTPLDVRRLLRRCLTKDARGRQQSAGDARLEIEEAMRGADGPAPAAGPSGRLRVLPAAAAALTVIAVSTLAFIAYSAKRPTDPQPVNVIRFTVPSPDGEDLASAAANDGPVAISPNGELLTFATEDHATRRRLWMRPISSLRAMHLVGADGASWPFWSPDNRAIGFFADGQLKIVDVVSGATRTVCQVPDSGTGRGGSWNGDDTIVFASGSGGGPILRVSASGGNPTPVTTLDEQAREWRHSFPVFLPGGQRFLFTARQ